MFFFFCGSVCFFRWFLVVCDIVLCLIWLVIWNCRFGLLFYVMCACGLCWVCCFSLRFLFGSLCGVFDLGGVFI